MMRATWALTDKTMGVISSQINTIVTFNRNPQNIAKMFVSFTVFISLIYHFHLFACSLQDDKRFSLKTKQKQERKKEKDVLWYFTLKLIKIYHLEKELQCFGSIPVIAIKHKRWRQPLILIWLLQHILCTSGVTQYSWLYTKKQNQASFIPR